jgi:hypothetical protein
VATGESTASAQDYSQRYALLVETFVVVVAHRDTDVSPNAAPADLKKELLVRPRTETRPYCVVGQRAHNVQLTRVSARRKRALHAYRNRTSCSCAAPILAGPRGPG